MVARHRATARCLFQKTFSRPEVIIPFLRHHLPPAQAQQLDYDSLVLKPGSFVGQALSQTHSDLLFHARLLGGENLFLYIVLEHQSTPDLWMPLRLLRSAVEIWNGESRDNQTTHLTPVVPFVVSQGPQRWQTSTEFADLFSPDILAQTDLLSCLPKFKHQLLDLAVCNPNDEEQELVLRFVLELMKQVRLRDAIDFILHFRELCLDLVQHEESRHLWRSSLFYALCTEGETLDIEAVRVKMEEIETATLKGKTMSIAQVLFAEGKKEGR